MRHRQRSHAVVLRPMLLDASWRKPRRCSGSCRSSGRLMDPVTHALSGAVLAGAILPNYEDEQAGRTARWTIILGAIFPDIDVLADPFDPDHFGTIRIHRSVTHSLVCLPVWALLFALLAGWYCRRRGIAAPPRRILGVLFGLGIALHILFDCITSFGTMVWSPISWTRVEWDWTFIIDLTLMGVLLFFLLLSWVAAGGERRRRRAVWMLVRMGAPSRACRSMPRRSIWRRRMPRRSPCRPTSPSGRDSRAPPAACTSGTFRSQVRRAPL